MKVLIYLLILPTFAFCQEEFTFPDELLANPYSYELKQLGIKRIEQSHITYWNSNNGFTKIDSSFYFDYILAFDTLGRIASFKYDFQKEYEGSVMAGPEGPITVYFHNDSSRLEPVIRFEDTVFYNYYENVFLYNEFNQIESIRVIRPYRAVIDGVYLAEHPKSKVHIEELYNDDLLIQRSHYTDDSLYFTETFEYQPFWTGEKQIQLLHRVTNNNPRTITVYTVSYSR